MVYTVLLAFEVACDLKDFCSFAGQETVHQLYGTRVAVLAGDFMFAQSSWYLANLENLEVIKLISQVRQKLISCNPKSSQSSFTVDILVNCILFVICICTVAGYQRFCKW